MESDCESDLDSLFDEIPDELVPHSVQEDDLNEYEIARITAPSIPGLYFNPTFSLPLEYTDYLFQQCLQTYFGNNNVNQVMLFERVSHDPEENGIAKEASFVNSKLPTFLAELLITLSASLRPHIPDPIHALLFPSAEAPPKARQVIINHYRPGEGITSHVDLLDRFGDGIIGISLGGSCVMRFRKLNPKEVGLRSGYHQKDEQNGGEAENVYLPAGSVYVMSGEARYGWTHGIERRKADFVQDSPDDERGRWIERSVRVSITFRWLLPGADIVGGAGENS